MIAIALFLYTGLSTQIFLPITGLVPTSLKLTLRLRKKIMEDKNKWEKELTIGERVNVRNKNIYKI